MPSSARATDATKSPRTSVAIRFMFVLSALEAESVRERANRRFLPDPGYQRQAVNRTTIRRQDITGLCSGWRDRGEEPLQARKLGGRFVVLQPLDRKMSLRTKIRVEMRVTTVERYGGGYRPLES